MNYNDIVEQTLTILKKSKLRDTVREFAFGDLKNDNPHIHPACHVILARPHSTAESIGTEATGDTQDSTEITIKMFATGATVVTATKLINALLDTAINTIKANPKFEYRGKKLFVRSVIQSAEIRQDTTGATKQIGIIIVKCQIGANITIKIPGIKDTVQVLFEPVGRNITDYHPHLNVEGLLVGYAATGESKTKFYEIEDTGIIIDKLEEIRTAKDKITFTVNKFGKDVEYAGYLSRANPGQSYDQKPTIALQFEII